MELEGTRPMGPTVRRLVVLALATATLVVGPGTAANASSDGVDANDDHAHEADDGLPLRGTGRYAGHYASVVLEHGTDIAHNPFALLVTFEPDADPDAVDLLLEGADAALVTRYGESDLYLLETMADLDKTRVTLESHPTVRRVEFDTTVQVDTSADPEAGSLWGLFGTHGIDADSAWESTGPLESVVVAVIDSGVDTDHPDLAATIWTNPGEIAGNGIDDDGNGYVDDIHGWDFVENDAIPDDPNGHGTHVAGTIAALRDNGVGVAGVTDNARIMALRFLDAEGSGYTSAALAALQYAIDNDAPISNNSWGGGGFNSALSSLIASVADTHLFVAAAGNSGLDTDVSPQYPAAYSASNILSVAAHNSGGTFASFSNRGHTTVDISAPGVSINSTWPGTGYHSISGTSMASPHAAGVAALLLGTNPQLSPGEMIDVIMQSGRPSADLAQTRSGAALDAGRALQFIGDGPDVTISGQPTDPEVMVGTTLTLSGSATASDGSDLTGSITWTDQDGSVLATGPTLSLTLNEAGTIQIAAEATDATGLIGRDEVGFDVIEPVVEFVSPTEHVTAQSGAALDVSWTWNGPAGTIGTLALAPITSVETEPSGPTAVISDHTTTVIPLQVPEDVVVDDLVVGLRVDHTYLWDLTIHLVSPAGTEVLLFDQRGDSGNDFGSGSDDCHGTPTVFSDDAAQSVTTGGAPFDGHWRPEEALSVFDGESSSGTWELRIRDGYSGDSGAVHCVTMSFTDHDGAATVRSGLQLADGAITVAHDELLAATSSQRNRLTMTGPGFGVAAAPGEIRLPAPAPPPPAPTPAAPTGVKASVDGTRVTVSWGAPSDDGGASVTGYTVRVEPGDTHCTTSVTSCELKGLTAGQTYRISVVAINTAGESSASEPINITPSKLRDGAAIGVDCHNGTDHPFTDLAPSPAAQRDTACIYQLGVTTGTGPETFAPTQATTRRQMAAFLIRLRTVLTAESCAEPHPFTDVSATSYAYEPVGCLYHLGITTGTSPTSFSPDAIVTRAQMAAFLSRMITELTGTPCGGSHPLTDVSATSYAYEPVGCLYHLGITTGTSPTTFSPDAIVTRAQMAAFMARTYRHLVDG